MRQPMIQSSIDPARDARVLTLTIPAIWEIQFPGKFMRRLYLSWWLVRLVWRQT